MNYGARHIYMNYFGLGDTSYREKVRYYEEHPDALSLLYFEEKIDIDIDYLLCLFEIGRYERFLIKADSVIETIIDENIYDYRGENIFHELLFRKAACLYQLHQYEKSKLILKQLIKMNKTCSLYTGLYAICNRKLHQDSFITLQAFAIASFMIVISITVARIFLIEPFFDTYLEPFLTLRMILVGVGLAIIAGLEIGFQYKLYKETGMFSHHLLNRIFNKS